MCGSLGLDKVGIEFDDRERLDVNEHYQTNVEHVYAAGDVIGFPALASTSMEQGRRAVCHAFGVCDVGNYNTSLFPYGIYAVPEISMVGKTEEQLTTEGIPYECGVAHYREIARGQLLGDALGMLKLLIHQDTHKLLGVHAIGAGATELIHIGQAVMALDGRRRVLHQQRLQLPDAGRVLQGGGVQRAEQAEPCAVRRGEEREIRGECRSLPLADRPRSLHFVPPGCSLLVPRSSSAMHLFAYGTLTFPEVWRRVVGRDLRVARDC